MKNTNISESEIKKMQLDKLLYGDDFCIKINGKWKRLDPNKLRSKKHVFKMYNDEMPQDELISLAQKRTKTNIYKSKTMGPTLRTDYGTGKIFQPGTRPPVCGGYPLICNKQTGHSNRYCMKKKYCKFKT